MSTAIDIVRWDAVTNKNPKTVSMAPNNPALYVLPTPELMEYARKANFYIPVKVTGTEFGAYDEKIAMAIVQPSEITAGFRPNFQADTNLICIIPDMVWQGYPNAMGKVSVLAQDFASFSQMEEYRDTRESCQIACQMVSVVQFAIIALVGIVCLKLMFRKG